MRASTIFAFCRFDSSECAAFRSSRSLHGEGLLWLAQQQLTGIEGLRCIERLLRSSWQPCAPPRHTFLNTAMVHQKYNQRESGRPPPPPRHMLLNSVTAHAKYKPGRAMPPPSPQRHTRLNAVMVPHNLLSLAVMAPSVSTTSHAVEYRHGPRAVDCRNGKHET